MKSHEFLAGGSMRVRGKNVSFNAIDINERLETRSYPYYSLFPSHHRHTVTLGPAVLFYLIKIKLPFDVGTMAVKRIAEARKTNVPSMSFPCLIMYLSIPRGIPKLESEKAKKRRLQRKSKEEKKAAVAIVVEEQGLDTRGELGTSTDILAPKRTTAPMRSSEPIPDWGVTLTTMVKDLTFEFRAFRDSFGSDGNYTRRTPYHPRKRTRIEGPSSFATGPDADSNENLEIAHTPPPYKPFDPTVEF
ncbi:hypothetical protein Q3G72_034641 [Acer saccharum]|nr:hypothetical protein Q3G72_034641 [Acer saccharum]